MRSKLQALRACRSAFMLTFVFGMLEVSGWACAFCGAALSTSPETQSLASSFRYGIAILMVTPYLVLGAIGFAIYRAYRKRIAARTAINPYSV